MLVGALPPVLRGTSIPSFGIGPEICRGALMVGRPFLFGPLRSEILLRSSDMLMVCPEKTSYKLKLPFVPARMNTTRIGDCEFTTIDGSVISDLSFQAKTSLIGQKY